MVLSCLGKSVLTHPNIISLLIFMGGRGTKITRAATHLVVQWAFQTLISASIQILTDWQDKKGDRRFLKLGKEHELGTPIKHGKPKKQKLEGKGGHSTGQGPGRPKSKNLQPKLQEYEFPDDPIDVPRIPKNDAPNRYGGVGFA